MKIKIKRFDKSLPLPTHDYGAAGFDFYCRKQISIPPRKIRTVPLNNIIGIPDGYTLLIFMRSSVCVEKSLMLANGVGIVDPFNYGDKDEKVIHVYNFSNKSIILEKGEKIAQGIMIRYESVVWEEIDTFGSKGRGYKTKKEKPLVKSAVKFYK